MIIIGLDPHPTSHTAVAMDQQGKTLSTIKVDNDELGLAELHEWAQTFTPRCWAIEGAGNRYAAPLLALIASLNDPTYPVHPSLTSQYRARRGSKKNDTVDAENIARIILANPGLPRYVPNNVATRLQELTRTRERLATQGKANRMSLAELPADSTPALREALESVVKAVEAAVKRMTADIERLVRQLAAPLLDMIGVGAVLAGTILAEVQDISRFPDSHHFASYCGAAPVERGSGKNIRWCVSTGGNRRLNRVLHLMALTRLRLDETTKAYVARKEQEGHTRRAALRALKTHFGVAPLLRSRG